VLSDAMTTDTAMGGGMTSDTAMGDATTMTDVQTVVRAHSP
jgi:hypothetical protein